MCSNPFFEAELDMNKVLGGSRKIFNFFYRIFSHRSSHRHEFLKKFIQIHVNGLLWVSFVTCTRMNGYEHITNGVLGVTKKYEIFSDFPTIEI